MFVCDEPSGAVLASQDSGPEIREAAHRSYPLWWLLLRSSRRGCAVYDSWVGLEKTSGSNALLADLKTTHPALKTLISLGG